MSTEYLMVPVVLDVLAVEIEQAVPCEFANFAKVPWSDGTNDYNASQPFLSSEVVSIPFEQDSQTLLKRGVHLHWALPDTLTRMVVMPDGETAYPLVPDVWVVQKTVGGVLSGQWIVESSYLFPSGSGAGAGAITIPWNIQEPDNGQPFRYLGRTIALPAWNANSQDSYWDGLTAIGYGEPTFSAFYPNCRSVFGFHDPICPTDWSQVSYSVIGFYRDPDSDLIHRFTNELPPNIDFSTWEADLETVFRWSLPNPPGSGQIPNQMACYAKWAWNESNGQSPGNMAGQTQVAIGNTGTEALSAWVASQLAAQYNLPDVAPINEDQLESVQLLDYLNSQNLDLGAKFLEARHANSFVAEQGGTLWTLQRYLTDGTAQNASDSASILFPEEGAEALNYINELQEEYQNKVFLLQSLQVQLFADWYKYMVASYPESGFASAYPPPQEIAYFIQRRDLPQMQQLTSDLGVLQLELDDNQNLTRANALDNNPASIAGRLANQLNNFLFLIQTVNASTKVQAAGTTFFLNAVDSPRYYMPRDPNIVLTGPLAVGTDRHGQDGLLPCMSINTSQPILGGQPGNTTFSPDMTYFLQLVTPGNQGYCSSTQYPWNPLLLEWRAEFLPILNGSNAPTAGNGKYSTAYINDSFELPVNLPDLQLKAGAGSTVANPSLFKGRSILTAGPGNFLTAKIIAALNDRLLPQYLKENPSVLPGNDFWENPANIRTVLDYYLAIPAVQAMTDQQKAIDPDLTLLYSLQLLQSTDYLSQSLDGFNAGLDQKEKTLQLPLREPTGFDFQRTFTESVAEWVGNENTLAPMPMNPFFPIRAGEARISQLRLVDTFGRWVELPVNGMIRSETMTPNDEDQGHIYLPPRLVQPARIQFRWLSAEHEVQEMNEHPDTQPVCGWFVPNLMDNSIWVYDSDGGALGLIARNATWQGAPGSESAVYETYNLPNPHLQMAVEDILRRGETFVEDFIVALNSGLENSMPDTYSQNAQLAMLFGQPLALVRAKAALQLKGTPAINESWASFRQDLSRNYRSTDQFDYVQFPVRVGESEQLSDGTIGYWLEDANGEIQNSLFYVPQSTEGLDDEIEGPSQGISNQIFNLSVQSPTQVLLMLFDVRGKVHITPGIVPVKTLDIPAVMYENALSKMEISFLTAPLLTEMNRLSTFLPLTPGYEWNWVERLRTDFMQTNEILPPETQAAFNGPFRLTEGWLKLSPIQNPPE